MSVFTLGQRCTASSFAGDLPYGISSKWKPTNGNALMLGAASAAAPPRQIVALVILNFHRSTRSGRRNFCPGGRRRPSFLRLQLPGITKETKKEHPRFR